MVMITNATRKRTLVKRAELADSVGKQTKGLMFRKSLDRDSGLLMAFARERKHEIWMMGMRFPIDIIFIGRDKRIVDIKHSVRPMSANPLTWRIYWPKKPCAYVLETAAGVAKDTGTRIGDMLEFCTRSDF